MKSQTDDHWNKRAASVENDVEVNLMDIFQREIELDYIAKWLRPEMTVLEVGCGNGFSTQRFRELVQHVDAFDYAENMVDRAKRNVGETNNRFFHDNIVAPENVDATYDLVICVRVLINLASLDAQREAIRNMARFTRTGGAIALAEGYVEGFEELSRLRGQVGLPPVEPAAINVYSAFGDLAAVWEAEGLTIEDEWHLGAYDYLTRVVYPLVSAPEPVQHNTVFSERCAELARAFNPDAFAPLSRMRGLLLRKA